MANYKNYNKLPGIEKIKQIVLDNWYKKNPIVTNSEIASLINNQVKELPEDLYFNDYNVSYLANNIMKLEKRIESGSRQPASKERPIEMKANIYKPKEFEVENKTAPEIIPLPEKLTRQNSEPGDSPVAKFFQDALYELDFAYESAREEIVKVRDKALETERKMRSILKAIEGDD